MALRLKTPMPSLEGITEWINGEPDLTTGKPLLVYFWAHSCHICHENMPVLETWREKYIPQGLQVISIHCPRMKTDTDVEMVKNSITECGIIEPCGIDNMHKVKKAFENELWPAYFIFDENHILVRRAAGKAGLPMLEPILDNLFEKTTA